MSKTKIKVHSPINEQIRYYRNYNYFYDVFTNYLKEFFDVEENRDFENAHCEKLKVDLKCGLSDDFFVGECEYVIENQENGEFVVMTASDYPLTHCVLNEYRAKNEKQKKVLISQYNPTIINDHITTNSEKFSPWAYFQQDFMDLDMYYEKGRHIETKSDKLYFRGGQGYRPILEHLDSNYTSEFGSVNRDHYFNEIISHKLALSVDGVGEFCYRDVELMGVGTPMIRYEFVSQMKAPLIPNFHYISIERPDDLPCYREGEKHHAEKLLDRYMQVINDDELLQFISTNARNYYLENFKYDSLVKNTFDYLELSDWINN